MLTTISAAAANPGAGLAESKVSDTQLVDWHPEPPTLAPKVSMNVPKFLPRIEVWNTVVEGWLYLERPDGTGRSVENSPESRDSMSETL
jgi:hypothetical protein